MRRQERPAAALGDGRIRRVPQTTVPPFVRVRIADRDLRHTFGRQGKVRVPIFVWSEYPGNKESLTILDA